MPAAEVIRLRSNHNLEHLTRRFHAALAKSVEGIIEAGACLIDGKNELPHGMFLEWVESLGISARTAQTMMLISRNPVLANTKNFSHLPACSKSLYELCQIPPQRLVKLLSEGKINAGQTIEQIVSIRHSNVTKGPQGRSTTPKIPRQLATLIDSCILLAGGDVVLGYIRSIMDIRELKPKAAEIDNASRWVKQRLRRKS